jgi:glycolate oxidase subunit GlcD
LDTLIQNLRACVGREQVLDAPDELLVYECDGLTQHRHAPRAVVFPRSTEEVSEVMRVLARAGVPSAPRGAGTGLSGGALALRGGVVIELARMRRVLEIDAENRLARVETGIVNAQLSRAVAKFDLHYAPDPSSQATCTIGGNIAENAGGIHCLKYGTTVDHVVGARVVLSDGEVIDLGGADGESAGYDLLGVFVGSEGTFGIATEAFVRLTPVAPSVRTLLADFTDIDAASRAVSAIIAEGIIPAALEMVDGATIRAVEASVFAAGIPLDAEAALLVELDGLEAGLDEETARVESICLEHGARRCRLAADEHERKKLWAARKGAFGAMGRISPDLMLQDAVVPRSRLPEVLADTYRIGAKYALRVANVFHAGDGNLHPFICFDARDAAEVLRVKEAGREIMETCVRAGGTITGEHGVGLDKSEYMPLIFTEDDLEAMLRVRAAFDPPGLCNPGKIIPAPKGCGEARAVSAHHSISSASPLAPFQHSADDVAKHFQRMNDDAADDNAQRRLRHLSSPERALDELKNIVGESHVEAEEGEGIKVSVSPGSIEEACAVLKIAAAANWKVVPAGAATWLDAGDPLQFFQLTVRTSRLSRIVEHEPADLVATAEAGVTLENFNYELGRAGQWLPLDSPGSGGATLGGIAATGTAGAQRLGYGATRSHVLGMRVALADGRVIRAGSRVVKNVAGYDLCKLFVGSFGTLGLILDVTFKLRPRPACEATLFARSSDYRELLRAARSIRGARLLPVAVELLSPDASASLGLEGARGDASLLVRFAGSSASVSFQLERARAILGTTATSAAIDFILEDARVWSKLSALDEQNEQNSQTAWRASVRPTKLDKLIDEINHGGMRDDTMWRAGVGDGRLRASVSSKIEEGALVAELRRLRAAARGAGGALVVERAPCEVKRAVGAWGIPSGPFASLMRRVKKQLDPEDMFSPGRFAIV